MKEKIYWAAFPGNTVVNLIIPEEVEKNPNAYHNTQEGMEYKEKSKRLFIQLARAKAENKDVFYSPEFNRTFELK